MTDWSFKIKLSLSIDNNDASDGSCPKTTDSEY